MPGKQKPMAGGLVERLDNLKVTRGIIVQMAKAGQLREIRCEMPTCYCPDGRREFAKRRRTMPQWALNADHYPTLRMDGGQLSPGNVRLAHVLCNREDYAWRKRVREMLEQHKSLDDIAVKLNDIGVRPPYGKNRWSPATVRRAYVS